MCGGLAAALSWLAGQGKADSFVPASEQSVKDLHNLLLAVASSTCFNSLTLQNYLGRRSGHLPNTFVTVSSALCLDFVSLDFHIPMTQIVISLCYEHRFQYVERRYSGFVALSFVVAAGTQLGDLRNQWVKARKILIWMPRGAHHGRSSRLSLAD